MDSPLYPGMHFSVQFELLNEGVAIPISSLENVLVVISHVNGQTLRKFAMSAVTGHSDYDTDNFSIIDSPAGKFEVVLTDTVTANAPVGDYNAEIKFKVTDSGYSSTGVAKRVFKFEDAKTKDVQL